jgi:tetratricopeptide (TPR) repeat protein
MKKEAEMNRVIKKAKRMRSRIMLMYIAGELDSSLELIKQAEELIRGFQGDLPRELEELHCWELRVKGSINAYREDLKFNFKLANELLTIAERYDNKWGISEAMYALGRNYWLGGDFDKSLMHFDRGLMLKDQIKAHDKAFYADMIRMATKIAVEKGDLVRARKYFNRIKEYFEQNPEEGGTLIIAYKLSEAYFLGSSMRSRDRIKAEELLKEIIEYGFSVDTYRIEAIVKLSELLLIELRLTNDIDVINEINPLISKLIEMTLKRKYNYYLIEAYVLQGICP